MATIGNIAVSLSANTAEFRRGLDRARASLQVFQGAALRVAGLLGGGVLIGRSIEEFRTAEQTINRFAGSVAAAGGNVRKSVNDIRAFASEIQRTTTIGDDAVVEMAALGQSIGGLSGDNLQQAIRAAIGFSKALGIDAVTAMQLVSKAATGNTTSFSKYGVKVDEAKTKQEQFNDILAKGNALFGIAESEALTASGALDQLKNSLSDTLEELGGFLLRGIRPFVVGLNSAIKFIIEMDSGLGRISIKLITIVSAFAAGTVAALRLANTLKVMASALKETAKTLAIVQALSGPKGWIALAGGIAAATGAMIFLDAAFNDAEPAIEKAAIAAKEYADDTDDMSESVSNTKERIDSLISSLREQADTLGFTNAQVDAYKLKALGADASTMELAQSLHDQIEAFNATKEAADSSAEALKNLMDEGRRIFEETRTPAEAMEAQLQRLDELVLAGAISWETYRRATQDAFLVAQRAQQAGATGRPSTVSATLRGSQQHIAALARFESQGFNRLQSIEEKSATLLARQYQTQRQIEANTRKRLSIDDSETVVNF